MPKPNKEKDEQGKAGMNKMKVDLEPSSDEFQSTDGKACPVQPGPIVVENSVFVEEEAEKARQEKKAVEANEYWKEAAEEAKREEQEEELEWKAQDQEMGVCRDRLRKIHKEIYDIDEACDAEAAENQRELEDAKLKNGHECEDKQKEL